MFFYCNKLSNNIIIVEMSGYIINPFSSDINQLENTSHSSQSIPIVAYGLIGVTSLTLAYLTLIDSTIDKSSSSMSATSLLPSGLFTKKEESTNNSIFSSPQENSTQERELFKKAYGGKSKSKNHNNKKKGRKTKSKK